MYVLYLEPQFRIMKKLLTLLLLSALFTSCAQKKEVANTNPVFPGWYADPEGIIFDDTYYIYPTYSAPYEEQVFLDVFSSPNLTEWTKHERIIDTSAVKWAKRAMWAPSIIKKDDKYYLFIRFIL